MCNDRRAGSELHDRIESWVNVGGNARGRPMNSLRILVVEDDILISMLLAEVLIGMGHEVCAIATTKADAVAAADRCKPG